MKTQKLLGVDVEFNTANNNLEKILLYLQNPIGFFNIVSLNPENMVVASEDRKFKKILSEGDIKLPDGVGIVWGGFVIGIPVQDRIQGVEFMKDILKLCKKRSLRVLFLGGKGKLAEELAERYHNIYPNSRFKGLEGISNIHTPTKQEIDTIFSIVADYKPQILFVAFGSPYQELWLDEHKDRLQGIVCMGVGGSFDFISGNVTRAPQILQRLGLEWLFRLIIEPWRWKRQLRLIKYVYLVFKQKLGLLSE